MTVQTIQVQATQPSAEESAAALAAAAAAAPTNEAEARAKIEADKAAAEAAKSTPERPSWLNEKFATPEDMAKAYEELEKKLGAPKEEPKPEGEKTAEELAKEAADKAKAEEAPKTAAEVVSDLNSKWEAQGQKLTDADYEAAAKAGYDKATVDSYIAGQQALAELATQRITNAAGGKESMDRMFAWASTSIPAAEIATFNKAFEGADVNAAVVAMEQLKTKYEAANGRDPKLVGGKPAGAATDVFTSWAQVSQAMSDKRYNTDHAYRLSVEQKLGRSDNIR
ncbi:hypothetical protein FJ420_01910 [Mesorhizobium sp. B3-1-3]|uniref:capsid assembly protein n=1 Tax=unclassified Mesorhizobium TaxID=325217 RepID=UPI001126F9E0|nr:MULTISPECIES: hypothetical protein [unclassified Mesorhizobium]TPI67591.1 hypothetical protein FJ424_09880 [Mesorhizobium sp. B3-1-8]TPI75637.1 hypothetical protein FJ420_01910 [Mesorhizobium sp. B3-1-3]